MRAPSLLCAIGMLAAGVAVAAASGGQTAAAGLPLRLSAVAADMGAVGNGSDAVLKITITRWANEKERQDLVGRAGEGSEALLRAFKGMPFHGHMAIPAWIGRDPHNARLGWDLRYAASAPLDDGGQRISIATDRYIGRLEALEQPRAAAYPFTLIEIRLDKRGKGTGKFAAATKIGFDKLTNQISFESYTSETVKLKSVTIEK